MIGKHRNSYGYLLSNKDLSLSFKILNFLNYFIIDIVSAETIYLKIKLHVISYQPKPKLLINFERNVILDETLISNLFSTVARNCHRPIFEMFDPIFEIPFADRMIYNAVTSNGLVHAL